MAMKKFKIDGEIESKSNELVIEENKISSINKKYYNLLLILSVLLFALVLFFAFNYYKTKENYTLMRDKIKKAENILNENDAYKEANDTLQKKILKLKHENDILAENNDSTNGVFFEVQIANFSEFNIDEYVNELRNLRQEKSEKGNKLCIGRFRSYRKALLFESDIKKMGFTNAFLVGRIDGKLVDFQTALAEYRRINIEQ